MATKKLRVELDLDTSKAKRKAAAVVETPAGGRLSPGAGGGMASTDRAAAAMDKLARSADNAGKGLGGISTQTASIVKGLTGMAVGMAMSYAKQYVPEGKYRDAVGYGGSILSGMGAGATAGAQLGSVVPGLGTTAGTIAGAVVGAAGGGVGEYMSQEGQHDAFVKDFNKGERDYRDAKAWQQQMKALSDVGDDVKDFGEKIKAVDKELARLRDTERSTIQGIAKAVDEHKYETASNLRGDLATNRTRQGQLEALRERFEDLGEAAAKAAEKAKKPTGAASIREGFAASDALSRVGGAFAGQSYMTDRAQRTFDEQLATLKSIDSKTHSGGSTWQ